jgi:hypothetical protein
MKGRPVEIKFNSPSEITPLVQILILYVEIHKNEGQIISKIAKVVQLISKFRIYKPGPNLKSECQNTKKKVKCCQ